MARPNNATPFALTTAQARANKAYRSAKGEVFDPGGSPFFDAVPSMGGDMYYQPTMPIRVEFRTYLSGTYRSSFTVFGDFGDFDTDGATFLVDITGSAVVNSTANPLGTALGSGPVSPDLAPMDCPIVEPEPVPGDPGSAEPGFCDPDPGPWSPTGPRTAPYLRYLPLPDKSQEPFLLVTNEPDGKISRSDMERRARQWSPETRAFMHGFLSVVYPDDYNGALATLAAEDPTFVDTGRSEDRLQAASRFLDATAALGSSLSVSGEVETVLAAQKAATPPSGVGPAVLARSMSPESGLLGGVIGAYPNPATSRVAIRAGQGATTARVFDIVGRHVQTIALSDGVGTWDLRGERGQRVAPGLYLINVEVGDRQVTHRITVL